MSAFFDDMDELDRILAVAYGQPRCAACGRGGNDDQADTVIDTRLSARHGSEPLCWPCRRWFVWDVSLVFRMNRALDGVR